MRGVIVVVCAWVMVAASYSAQAPTFGGYACADNCSGHAAGGFPLSSSSAPRCGSSA
jgi:hypothetical protein